MSDIKGTVIASDLGFTEGPVIRQRGDYICTSCDRGLLYRVDGGVASVFAETGGGPNGSTEGADGKIYVAQNGRGVPPYGERLRGITGGVQVVSPDGSNVDWVTQDPVSPNDLCFGPDGLLYVTDPTRPAVRRNGRLWSIDVESGETEILAQMDWYPNGIGFGLDPHVLFVVNMSDRQIVRFALDDGRLGSPEVFIEFEKGSADGFDFDAEGNLVASVPGAGRIETWSMEGKLLDVTVVGDGEHGFTNIALDENRVLIGCDARHGTLVEYHDWPGVGLPLYPFRSAT